MKKVLISGFSILALATILVSATIAIQTEKAEKYGLVVGDTAPDFNLKNVDGKMISLADFEDINGFVINFTCNTCPVSQMYEDRVVALQDKLESKGYPVINIMPNDVGMKAGDSFEEMKKRAKKVGYHYYLIDEKQEIFPQYGATRTPHIFLLDKDLMVRYIGAIDDDSNEDGVTQNYVLNAVAALEAGKEPDPSFTKAVGCSIKVNRQ